MHVLFRADASVQIGTGHIMRCLTLATALRTHGVSCSFAARNYDGNLNQVIIDNNFQLIELPTTSMMGNLDEVEDATITLKQLKQHYDVLVIDNYQLAACFSKLLRQRCKYIMQIDDLANRVLDCDLLLNQNLLPDLEKVYVNHLPLQCTTLLGPVYALLRQEFYNHHVSKIRKHLLVFGGSDEHNLTEKALTALIKLKLTNLPVDIVIGKSNPWQTQLKTLLNALPNAVLHVQCNNMAELMKRAQLMLGTGGTSHWERCISSLPGLVVTVAENQQATTAYLNQLGACVWLGQAAEMSAALFAEQLCYYLSQPALLDKMSLVASGIVPANAGTSLVAEHIVNLMART